MREAIGSYWLTMIFITFIVLFTGYLCLSINMNKAYKVKNEIITIIQKNNGLNEEALTQIQDYMVSVGYRTTGNCNISIDDGYSGYSMTSKGPTSNKTVFCAREMVTEYEEEQYTKAQFPKVAYYQVKVFFAVDLPVIRNLFTFSITGSTKKLFYPAML